jgi:hypothetical protein
MDSNRAAAIDRMFIRCPFLTLKDGAASSMPVTKLHKALVLLRFADERSLQNAKRQARGLADSQNAIAHSRCGAVGLNGSSVEAAAPISVASAMDPGSPDHNDRGRRP